MEVIFLFRKTAYQNQIATALIRGSNQYPAIKGSVIFRQQANGVLVTAEIYGLPHSDDPCRRGVFGFHIHEGRSCSGTEADPFADTGTHFNPQGCPHPYHAGDLPPLFENNGYAYLSVLTNRFKLNEVLGRTVVIHSNPDDFKTQPSGDSGTKIACGKIQ